MSNLATPLVSIITVNYKQTEVTLLLLESLLKCNYSNKEVIVVDNGSNEGLEAILHAQYPWVRCVTSQQNLGFAGGNNLGMAIANGQHLLFLNNDTEVESNFLEPMVALLESDSTIGMVSPKIIYFGTDNILQYAGSKGINPYTGRGKKIGSFEKDFGQYNTTYETSLAHGAAMLVPKKVIEQVGMLPDIFFLYYEEHDWCEAIKRVGYKIYYVGQSIVYHKESVSVGRTSPLKTYYMTRNRLLFLRRNNKGLALLTSLLFFVLFAIPKATIKYFFKAQWQHLSAFYKGVAWNLVHFHIHGFPRLTRA